MMNLMKKMFGVVLALSLAAMGTLTVNASAENVKPVDEVFPEELVDQLANQIKNQPIYHDKDEDGQISIKKTRSSGTYPTRNGVILVTDDKYKGLIPTGHAAIIWTSSTVVESLQDGVTTGPNDWNTSKKTCYGVSVRGTTTVQDDEASNWCYKQTGKPYNWNYFNVSTREKFYCSQLVWAAFKDNYGIDLNTSDFGSAVHPMELVNSSNTYTLYEK